jgi:hypothetical protein
MTTKQILELIAHKTDPTLTIEMSLGREISKFVLLWGVYESRFYRISATGNSCTQNDMVQAIRENRFSRTNFEPYFKRFKKRYLSSDGGRHKFETLYLNDHPPRGYTIDSTFEDEIWNRLNNNPSAIEIQKTVLAIIYRLRNNLFHGRKDFHNLNLELEPLKIANACLYDLINNNRFFN